MVVRDDTKLLEEFKGLLNGMLEVKEAFDAKLVALGKLDALAFDRAGQRGPGLFERSDT